MSKKQICKITDCGNPSKSKGYCSSHYMRMYRYGNPLVVKGPMPIKSISGLCEIDGCSEKHLARGWCRKHYLRNWFHGDPNKTLRRGTDEGMKFISEAIETETDDCINWPFSLAARGYGRIMYEGKNEYVSRVVLIKTQGPPPTPQHEACHSPLICNNSACINKRHLRWATHAENMADMAIDGTRSGGGAFHKKYIERKIYD